MWKLYIFLYHFPIFIKYLQKTPKVQAVNFEQTQKKFLFEAINKSKRHKIITYFCY